ncbi:MAG: OmpA family protein [Bdellovibrionaceae bacterium]|nr:OmpA family protein [Pseudobdellovibrionaceae bacterium]
MASKRYAQLIITTGLALFLGACAHDIKPSAVPASANPSAEVDSLTASVDAARNQNLDVLSPENFKKAEKSMKEAQDRRAKGKKGERILESVGYGRAYLDRAHVASQQSREQLVDVLRARELAMAAGAAKYHNERVDLDKDLKKYTEKIENGKKIDRSDLTDLQQDYLDLELKSIKDIKLGEAKNLIDNAEKQGAKHAVPTYLKEAQEKYEVAEKTIETDRHDMNAVNAVSGAAIASAQKAMTLLQTAKENRKRTPEQIASEIENRNRQIDESAALNTATAAQVTATQAQVTAREQQLAQQRVQFGAVEDEKAKLEAREKFNQVFEQARAEFKDNEADVYRQGDNMIIRLKAMKFSSGRSDLPAASLSVLSKVKDVIGQLSPEDVVVEGHTDSTGAAALNKKLSSERAEAVASYFVSDKTVDSSKVEAVGYGFEKPIATNKNKAGREQNRRVDIIIKLSQTATAAQPEDAQQKSPASVH